jgi:hypothetical protein
MRLSSLRGARAIELATYAVLAVAGAGVAAGSFSYGLLVDGGLVGPGLLPLVAGVLVFAFSGALLARAWRGQVPVDDAPVEPRRVRVVWVVFGLLLVTLLLAPLIGFLPAFGLFVFVVSRFVERRPWWWSVVVAVLAGVVLYVVFVVFLNVPLPGGPLGLGGDG